MKNQIKNEKELEKLLNTPISVPIFYEIDDLDNGTIAENRIIIDEEGMREFFEEELERIISLINNF